MLKFWFFAVCVGLIFTKVKNEVTLIDGLDYVSCVATENHISAALTLLHDTTETTHFDYDPRLKIDVDFTKKEEGWTDVLDLDRSLKVDYGLVLDRRWEQFATYSGNRQYYSWPDCLVAKTHNPSTHEFGGLDRIFIPISVKGEGPFDLMLCNNNENVETLARCFWILFNKPETVIKKCSKIDRYYTNAICKDLQTVEGKTISKDKWSHFYIVKNFGTVNIFKLGEEEPFLTYTDTYNIEGYSTKTVYARLRSEGQYKIHDYNFMTTTQSAEEKLLGDLSSYYNEELFCLALTLKMCESCSLQLTLKSEISNYGLTDRNTTIYTSHTAEWKEHIFAVNITNHKSERKYLFIKTLGVHVDQFWSIGYIRSCSLNETRALSIKKLPRIDVFCHVVGSNYTFKLEMPQNITNRDKCEDFDEIRMGTNCYRLSKDYQSYNKRKRICNLNEGTVKCYCLPGHMGKYCSDPCSLGKYGYNCLNSCGKCNYYWNYKTCDYVNGKCLHGCQENFEGDECQIGTYPTLLEAPKIIDVGYTSVKVEINFNYTGKKVPVAYQFQTFNCDTEKIWKDSVGYSWHDFGPIEIKNLLPSMQYRIRAVLIADDHRSTFDFIKESETFTTKCDEIQLEENEITNSSAVFDVVKKDTSCPLDDYTLLLNGKLQNQKITLQNVNLTIRNLEPYTLYELLLKNRKTNKNISEEFRTQQGEPQAVDTLTCGSSTNKTIYIHWEKPKKANGIIQGYEIKYRHLKYRNCSSSTYGHEHPLTINDTKIQISELRPYSVYEFKISAVTIVEGPETPIRCKTKATDIPDNEEIPKFKRDFNITSNSLSLHHSINCEEMKGELKYFAKIECLSFWCMNKTESINGSGIHFSGLIPYTQYSIKLKTQRLNGKFSSIDIEENFVTLSSAPPNVTNIVAYSYNGSVVWLRWKPPYPPYGQLESYYIKFGEMGTYKPPMNCSIWEDEHCQSLVYKTYGYITIAAKNEGVPEMNEEHLLFTSNYNAPGQPLNPQAHFDDSDVLLTNWQHPDKLYGYLLGFDVDIFLGKNKIYTDNYTDNFEQLNFSLPIDMGSSIIPYAKEIEIEVKTKNNKGVTAAKRIKLLCPPQTPYYEINHVEKKDRSNTSIDIVMPTINGLSNESFSCLYAVMINNDDKEENKLPEEIRSKCDINKDSESWIAYAYQFDKTQVTGLTMEIGKGSSEEEICDVKVTNQKLSPYVDYGVCLLIVTRFKEYNRYAIQKFKRSDSGFHGVPKPIESSNGGLYALIFLFILVPLIGFVLYKKRHLLKQNSVQPPNNNPDLVPIIQSSSRTAMPMTQRTKSMIEKPKLKSPPVEKEEQIYSKLIPLADFEKYIKDSLRMGELEKQHNLFPRGQTKPWTYGSEKPNKTKNRYNNLIAYDHSRVVLEHIEGDQYSDYINANYIDGYNVPKAFIATQGPKVATVNDFWRMIWQENVHYIVMLANVIEGGKKKTEQYWPNINETLTFGPIAVTFLSTQLFADYEYRSFAVFNKDEERKVEQLHFTSWPDHGVPLYSQSLVPFLQKLLKIPQGNSPIVVHCSAGVGRTGTIILSDICLRMAAREGQVDVLRNLQKIRNQRPNMVDNVQQYKLVHMVLLDCLFAPITNIPCDGHFEEKVQKIISSEIDSQLHYLENSKWQDDIMKSMVVDAEAIAKFPHKDRYPEIVPDSLGQVFISRYPNDDAESSYINAVFVDGFRAPKRYIVTQQPLPNTLGDFWRLVYEQDSSVIISLNQIKKTDKKSTVFWPSEKNPVIKPVEYLTVEFSQRVESEIYDSLTLSIENENRAQNRKTIYLVLFKSWKYEMLVPNQPDHLLSLCEEGERLSRIGGPVIVTCYDGARASGLFLATSFIIEKIKLEQICDICLAIRVIRHNRKHFIQQREQFVYLYELALQYIQGFEIYSNFVN